MLALPWIFFRVSFRTLGAIVLANGLLAQPSDPLAELIYEEDFESGTLGDGWVIDGWEDSRARIVEIDGSRQLLLDDASDDDHSSQARATVIQEGGEYGAFWISFEATSHDDEFQVSSLGLDLVDFIDSYSPVATFRLHDHLPLEGNKVKIEYEVKVASNFSSSFGFRFWQYGSKSYPNDGWSFDNLKIYGLPPVSKEIELQPASDDSFDVGLRSGAMPEWPIPVSGTDKYLISGNFDRVAGEVSDSIAWVDENGDFELLAQGLGLKGIVAKEAVLNSDGSVTIRFSHVGEVRGDRIAVISQEGELLSLTDSFGEILMPDSRFVAVETGTYENAQGFPRDRFRLRFKNRDANGVISSEAFASDWVNGTFWSLHRLADGGFLGMGDLYSADESLRGQLARFEADGNLDTEFGNYGYISENGNSYEREVYSFPTGEVFVYNRYGEDGLTKIHSDGTVDSSFNLDESLHEGWSMKLFPRPDGSFYLWGAYGSDSNTFPSLFRIEANGRLDSSFHFSGEAVPTQYESFVWIPVGESEGIAFSKSASGVEVFELANDGSTEFREESPLEKAVMGQSDWLPTGEIVLEHFGDEGERFISIARADGSLRVNSFELEDGNDLLPLAGGGFAAPSGERFDESLLPLAALDIPPFTEVLEVLPDGGYLARWHEDRFGSGEAIVKLNADGSLNTDFPKMPKRSRFLDINRSFIYYVAEDENGFGGNTLRRIRLDGVEDAGFAFDPEGVSLDNLVATDTHLYFERDDKPISEFFKNWRGIKMSLSGGVDETYNPNSKFQIGGGISVYYLEDGSSIQSGRLEGDLDQSVGSKLFFVSPMGEVSELDPYFRWVSYRIDVLEDHDILISGNGYTDRSGIVNMTKRYKRSEVGFSIPKTTYVAWPENENIVVDAAVHAPDEASLQWLKEGVPQVGQTQARLEVPASDFGSFELEVTSNGATFLGPTVIVVPVRKPEITRVPESRKALFGTDVTLEARAGSPLGAELQWYFNDAPLVGETSVYLTLGNIGVEDLGSYQLRARNEIGDTWSDIAYVTGEGPIPAVNEQLELVKYSNLAAKAIIPREDGAVWLKYEDIKYDPYPSNFENYRLVKVGGELEDDFIGKLNLASEERLLVCPLSGIPFLISTEDRNGEGIRRHRISRLDLDGRVDGNFTPLVVDGEWSAAVELWNKADGVLLVRVGEAAYARYADGGLEDYALPELEAFLRRFEKRNISWGEEYLGSWADGTELELFTDEKELRAKSSDGTHLWSFPLGSFHIPPIFLESFGLIGFEYARSRPSEDGRRIYVRIYEDEAYGSPYRIAWFEKDGSNNLDTAQAWPGELHCQALSVSSNGDLFVAGLEKGGSGSETFAIRGMVSNGSPGESIPQVSHSPVQSAELYGSSGDHWLYLTHDGNALADGTDVGPLLRLDESGALDLAFQTDKTLPVGAKVETVSTLSNGGALVVVTSAGVKQVLVMSSKGALLSEVSLSDALSLPDVLPATNGRWYMLESTSGGKRLRRFSASGEIDGEFESMNLGENSLLLAIDSDDRPYFTDTDGDGEIRVFRSSEFGARDEGFSIDTGMTQLRFQFAIDANDRIWRLKLDEGGELLLERFLVDGTIDLGFAAVVVDQENVKVLRPLFNDSILVGEVVYSELGDRLFAIEDYHSNWSSVFGDTVTKGGFASVRVLPGTEGVELTKWLLREGLELRYATRGYSFDEKGRGQLVVDLDEGTVPSLRWTLNGTLIDAEYSNALAIVSPARGMENRYQAFLEFGGSEVRVLDILTAGNWAPFIDFVFHDGLIEASWPFEEGSPWTLQSYSQNSGWRNVDSGFLIESDPSRVTFEFPESGTAMPLLLRLKSGN